MKTELESILKDAGAIRLRATLEYTPFRTTCKVSRAYEKDLPFRVIVIDSTIQYLLLDIITDERCKMDQAIVSRDLPLIDKSLVYVAPADQLTRLTKQIPMLRKYF